MKLFTRLLMVSIAIYFVNNDVLAQDVSSGNKWTTFGINRMHFQDYSMSIPAKDTCCNTGLSFLDRSTVTLGGLSVYRNFSKTFAASADIGIAYGYAAEKSNDSNATAVNNTEKKLKWSQTARADLYINFATNKLRLQPYLFAGVHGSYYQEQISLTIPAGIGFRFLVPNDAGMITAQYGYGWAFSEHVQKNNITSVGLYLRIGKRRDRTTSEKKVVKADQQKFNEAKIKPEKNKSEKNKTPQNTSPAGKKDHIVFKGMEIKNTIPAPKNITIESDKDKDGVVDSKDKCPTVPGLLSNNGCPTNAPTVNVVAMDQDILQKKIIPGKDTTLFVIHFDAYKYDLNVSFKILTRLKDTLIANQLYHCIITGHSDNEGDDAFNKKLSQMRAQMVATYLSSYYVEPNRIAVISLANSQPVIKSQDKDYIWMNRRVEVKIFKPQKK
jgi:outer membrane protein OmpA-like peptidoglycan-associated protein